jgi:6-phosphogluconolactonase
MTEPRVQVVAGLDEWAAAAARGIAITLATALGARGKATLALSGGETPRLAYRLLAQPPYRDEIDWARIALFFGDERCVPPENKESNFHMVETTLLASLPTRPLINRILGELPPEEAARSYEATLRLGVGAQPVFDLMLLGLGKDGHTASLFPGSPALAEERRLAVATDGPGAAETGPRVRRVTLTLPVINAARNVLFLVAGAEKAQMLARVTAEQAGGTSDVLLPAARVRPRHGRVLWLVDDAAARALPPPAEPSMPGRAGAGIE